MVEREGLEPDHNLLILLTSLNCRIIRTIPGTSWGGELNRADVRPSEQMASFPLSLTPAASSRAPACYPASMTSERLDSQVLRTLRTLEPELRAAGVRHISVFGSVARGEDTANSDVDLALDLAPDTTPPGFQFVVYIERLKQRLATALSRDVDIVVLPARRQKLRETLSREAIAAF